MIKNTRKETLEKLVIKVFNEEIDGIVKELDLDITPTYEFSTDPDDNSTSAYVTTDYSYTRIDFSTIKITKTWTDGVIHINLNTLAKECDMYKTFCKCNVDREVILFILRHECRHIWQNTTGWHNGRIESRFDFDTSYESYSSRPQEQDANTFALNTTDNKVRVIGELLVEESNITNAMYILGDRGRMDELASTVYRTHKPVQYHVLNNLKTIAYNVRYLIKKINKAS